MHKGSLVALLGAGLLLSASAAAFDSGSTGADGALEPNVDTAVPLPADGILDYTTINIPSGVTVTFTRNALNTPVTLLVSGDATIAGTIDLSGKAAADSNGAGSGNVGDDGLPGEGGAGGFGGGRGGRADASIAAGSPRIGQGGIGPGGGRPMVTRLDYPYCYGGAGSFGTVGHFYNYCGSNGAPVYGNPDLLPLVGGSGGAGGNGMDTLGGSGGGGGGGALLLAVTGTLNVTGTIRADGGAGGNMGHNHAQGGLIGGGGSGGGIRLVATTLSGNGTISAVGGRSGTYLNSGNEGNGGVGRIRLEAEFFQRSTGTNPAYTTGSPGDLVVTGLPTIRISQVAGINAPAQPTGNADIVLPADAPDPVGLVLATTNVPLGNTISIIVTPASGTQQTVVSTAIQGSEAVGSASANVSLPDGNTVLLATLSFSVAGEQANALSRYTEGEPVARVELVASLGGVPQTTLITAGGRRIDIPASAL